MSCERTFRKMGEVKVVFGECQVFQRMKCGRLCPTFLDSEKSVYAGFSMLIFVQHFSFINVLNV